MDPTVSIVVTTYNQARYLSLTIQSALRQTYANRELIVVDDGSTDETSAALAEFGSSIRVVRQPNRGVACARNTGVQHARGELVAFLDGDDLWTPEKIALQVAAYTEHRDVGLIAGDALIFSESELLRPSTLPWGRPPLQHLAGAVVRANVWEALVPGNIIATTSQVMVPRKVLEEVGASDAQFRIASDYDLYLRIAERYEFAFLRSVVAHWRYLPTSVSGPQTLRPLRFWREEVAVLKKHYSSSLGADRRGALARAIRHKIRGAAAEAYYYGTDVDSSFARRYLFELWWSNRRHAWPLVYCMGLQCPAAVRRRAAAVLRPFMLRIGSDGAR